MVADKTSPALHHRLFSYLCRYDCFIASLAILCAYDVRRSNRDVGYDKSGAVLVIKHGRFRGDVEILRARSRLPLLKLPNQWPGRFYRWFYGINDVHLSRSTESVERQQEEYREFLRRFLPRLFKRLSVRVLMNSGINYKIALDWVFVARMVECPSVVFHREGYMGSKHEEDHLMSFGDRGRRFEGSKLVLQTELQRRVLIHGGFVGSDNSAAVGTLRFDDLLNSKSLQGEVNQEDRHWVTFFSFGISTGFLSARPPYWPTNNESDYLLEFTRSSHIAVAEYAKKNPDVKVMIKTKWAKRWFEKVHEFLDSASLSADLIPNLIVTDQVDSVPAQISRSRVVVGYGSTTLLEAAITGIPVIMPFFSEIAEARFSKYVCYPDIFECFDVAESPAALQRLINNRYRNFETVPDKKIMDLRVRAFERYIGPCDGQSTLRAERVLEEMYQMS